MMSLLKSNWGKKKHPKCHCLGTGVRGCCVLLRQHQSRLAITAFCMKLKEELTREGMWEINFLQVCRLQSLLIMADAVQNSLFQCPECCARKSARRQQI